MMTITQIVENVEYLIYLQRQRHVKRAAGPEAAAKLEARIADIASVLPPMENTPWPTGINMVALGRADRNALLKTMEDNEKRIATLLEEAKKDAWKWSGRKEGPKEPVEVAQLRNANLELENQVTVIEERLKPIEIILADEERAIAEENTLSNWVVGGYSEPTPAHVARYTKAFHKDIVAEGVVRLRMPSHPSCVVVV
jgi:hypothetical protein